jgi:TonB family protein
MSMDRLQKKCLLGSTLLHGFLLLLLLFGSAFFVAKEKTLTLPRINVVPSKLVDDALAGGGGNPNLPRTDDQQKGQTLQPQPAPAPPVEKVQPKPALPEPVKPPPAPKETPKPVVEKTPAIKPTDLKKLEPKPKETPKPSDDILSQLKPIKPTKTDREKARKEAEAQEAARQAAEAARQARLARERFANALGKATAALQRGFQSGTKIEVGGPGGEAYANYAAFVQAIYDEAWKVQPDFADDDASVSVKVTIARDGRVLDSHIVRRSSLSLMDKSVQRALDDVKRKGLPPFPEGSHDTERTFEIEFNLKAKRLAG